MAGIFPYFELLKHIDAIEEIEHRGRPRIHRPRRDPFEDYSDAEFLKRFRFTKQAVRDLEERLRPQLARHNYRNRPISSLLQVTYNCPSLLCHK